MKNCLVVLGASLLLACASSKEVKIDNVSIQSENIEDSIENATVSIKDFNVVVSVNYYTPYCGGMAPTDEMIANQTTPQANTQFILIDLNSNKKSKVISDSKGQLFLSLSKGKYAIREIFKDCSFEEFRKNNPAPNGENYQQSLDPDCYEKWWKSYLIEFEISDSESLNEFSCQSAEQCFTGNNPCIFYNGPWPP